MLACFRDVNIYTNASLQTVRCTFKLILDSLAPLRPVQPPQKKKREREKLERATRQDKQKKRNQKQRFQEILRRCGNQRYPGRWAKEKKKKCGKSVWQ